MRRDLRGKRILITGASGGIGRALAEAAGARGARVVLAARAKDRLDAAVNQLRSRNVDAHAVVADVTVAGDRQRMFDEVSRLLGGLDILVNNAGVAAHGHFVDLDEDILRKTMEVNFFAGAENCRLAIPLLAEGVDALIVNISSMAGRRGVPAWTEYSASKFAVCGFSEALRPELARFDIDVMLVVPGLTNSEFGDHLLARKGRMPIQFSKGIPPATVAQKIVAGIERNKRELWIEREARLLLLVNWLAPWFVDWRMRKVVEKLYAAEIEVRRMRRRDGLAADSVNARE